nr:serine/threonine-protein kinase ssp1 [Quercus suber]
MSHASQEEEHREHGSHQDMSEYISDDMETPKSEMPLAAHANLSEGPTGGDYFAPARAGMTQRTMLAPPTHATLPAHGTAAAPAASILNASGHIEVPEAVLSPPERPSPHTNLSGISADSSGSATTITPLYAPRPTFPNQSYAALHHQQYPAPHVPPTLRQRSSHPGQIFTFASALASSHHNGSRTVGNSPAVTPGNGLFSPPSQPVQPRNESETSGTYSSPFLHFTHRQMPKETHVADVDVDPISGRKLINHYEIIDELGRGTHGKVKLGRDLQTENTHVAIKIVERYSKRRKLGKLGQAEDKVKKEVAILKKARHPNVVALLEVIDDPSRKKVYIVLEWVARGEIHWRTKARKEIAMVEARRYERERSGKNNEVTKAEDAAVLAQAKKRLAKVRRSEIKKYRQERRDATELPEHMWSAEVTGDNESDQSDDEYLSRASTATTDSVPAKSFREESRLPSRTSSPLYDFKDKERSKYTTPIGLATSNTVHFLPLSAEPEHSLNTSYEKAHTMFERAGLEGPVYGAYDSNSPGHSGYASLSSSLHSLSDAHVSTEEVLAQLASEVLDSDLNPELEYVPVMTLQQARVAFRDTLLGLQYLHYQGIVHRDIKPPNLLSTIDHRVKISDFGVSYLGRPLNEGDAGEDVSEHEAQDFDEAKELAKTVGTPAFYAPELCITDPGDDPLPVTKAIDVWALGITLFCMLFARTPYVDNEFIVMRQIADEDIYIPRRRLLPVQLDRKPRSRPNSHTRAFPGLHMSRRSEHDFVYEEIDDELHDLLRRLLTKDPRRRITLEEVRHHPWVLADLSSKIKWLEDTDPSRQSQGKKIEVSKEDVNTAVVQLQFLDRVRSGIKKVGERLGLSSKQPSRGRAQSNAAMSTGGSSAPSPHSSSSTISQDARRHSLRGDESIFSALQRSREGDHPLRSVAPSPELPRGKSHEDLVAKVSESSEDEIGDILRPTRSRPNPPQRSHTIMSTTGSGRTLKASELRDRSESPTPSPGLPGTPIALDSPGGHGLSTILGSGPARRVLRSLRERSSQRGFDVKMPSYETSSDSTNQHAGPSIAISQTIAPGQVNPPDALRDLPPVSSAPSSTAASVRSSAHTSPVHATFRSNMSSTPGHPLPLTPGPSVRTRSMSRQGSASSITSVRGLTPSVTSTPAISRPSSRMAPESSAEDHERAEQELARRFVREREIIEGQPRSPVDATSDPSSLDDTEHVRPDSRPMSGFGTTQINASHETSPTSHTVFPQSAMLSSTSDLGSAVSNSISNPSIPSVISEASSIDLPECMPMDTQYEDDKGNTSSEGTINLPSSLEDEDTSAMEEGYNPGQDQNFDSDNDEEYESSSDSDGGLVMQRRKSIPSKAMTNISSENTRRLGSKEHRSTDLSIRSRKSSRSGSNNTMKKVRTRDSIDDDR